MWKNDFKVIKPAKLAKLLTQLPKGSFVMPNTVGNLMIVNKDFKVIGHIDFAWDVLEMWDKPSDMITTHRNGQAAL